MHDPTTPSPADIAAIERATVAAVAPESVVELTGLPGWLLPVDSGTVNRARSAVPLLHELDPSGDVVHAMEVIEAAYLARGMPAIFRLPERPAFEALRGALAARGYTAGEPVAVQVARAADVRSMQGASIQESAQLDAAPDAAWAALFLGPGFDPVDGASRVAVLSRATGSMFASVRRDGDTVAGGIGAFSHGWASVHGMRTAATHRRQGLARRVMAAIAQEALARGVERIFLQVEQQNAPALALYRRAGFSTGWRYRYWQRAL